MEMEAKSLADMIESDAVSIENALQTNTEKAVDDVVNTIDWDKAFQLEDEADDLANKLKGR